MAKKKATKTKDGDESSGLGLVGGVAAGAAAGSFLAPLGAAVGALIGASGAVPTDAESARSAVKKVKATTGKSATAVKKVVKKVTKKPAAKPTKKAPAKRKS